MVMPSATGASPAAATPTPVASPEAENEVEMPQANAPESTAASPAEVFRLDFMRRALVAGLLVGGVCAFLGIYVVLRRIVFVGVALAEMSSAGVALGLLTGRAPMLGSVLVMLAGVVLVSVRWGGRRIRQDAFIGIGYVVASAASILLIAKSPSGEGSLLDLLFGNILTVTAGDVRATAAALALVLLFHALFFKELLFVAFDPDTAAASGYRARVWEMLLYLTIGLTIAFAIHAVGVLLTFGSLVIPPVTALLLTRRMNTALGVSVATGMLPVPIGLYVSFVADLPAAATVVAVSFAFLLAAGAFSRLRA
jgi:ABC-type Mn2+/Zn2+ transport system permease subunit